MAERKYIGGLRTDAFPTLLSLPDPLLPRPTRSVGPPSAKSSSRAYPLLLGVDGGATKTAAALFDLATHKAYRAYAGASNPHAVGFEAAASSIIKSIEQVLQRAETPAEDVSVAVLGIASVDTDADRQRIEQAVKLKLSLKPLYVINDVVSAWAAGTLGEPGIALISGTGSNCFGVDITGRTWRAGGWGHILGDEGSGYWIGLQAMRVAVAFRDGRGEWSEIVPRVLSRYGFDVIEDLHSFVYENFDKADIAALTPDVVEAAKMGDKLATKILHRAGVDLARHVKAVVGKLSISGSFPVVIVGSTFQAGGILTDPLVDNLSRYVPGARLVHPLLPPVGGSVWLAARAIHLDKSISLDLLARSLEGEG